jgi:cation diffusion facilitator family transporter
MNGTLTNKQVNRLEQRTLSISIYTIIGLAIAGIGYGLYIGSDAVMLDGFYALTSLMGSGLYLLAAKVVEKPADRHFQYGYAHIEPLVNSFNSLILMIVCIYAFFNGLRGLASEGNPVDATEVVVYSLLSAVVCAVVWIHERRVAKRCDSDLIRNDAREWMVSMSFSVVTGLSFALIWVLPEPARTWWANYADSAVLSILALCLAPLPMKTFYTNMREVLVITNPSDEITLRVAEVMQKVEAEYDIAESSCHIVKSGRIYVIEINIMVGPDFKVNSVNELDLLRSRIWQEIGLPLDDAWLGISFTANPRWL